MRKSVKTVLISSIAIVLVAAIAVGILWYLGQNTEPVKVSPVSAHTLGYYNDTAYFDGQVTADNLQSLYLSDTQMITEILVTEGQEVKKGDALVRYDTTLSDIQLKRQEIAVQQAKLALEQSKKDLNRINAMKPYSPPPATVAPTEPPTEPLTPVDELPYLAGGNGTREKPYRILWSEDLTYDDEYIGGLLGDQSEIWIAFEIREENALKGDVLDRWGLRVTVKSSGIERTNETEETPTADPTEVPQETVEPAPVEPGKKLAYSFFTPADEPENNTPVIDDSKPWVDNSSGYTAAEIAKMRAEKQKEIRDRDLAYRMAQVEYERKKTEADNSTVFSEVDGTVTRLVDEETARTEGSPLMVVSGGGCYYVNIAIGEYDREIYPVGTPVMIQTWSGNGTQVTGTIDSITDTPTTGWYNGNGNPNVTFYNAVIAVPADAMLNEGEYVSVSINAGSDDVSVLWLENMYIRYEDNRAYVYKRGEDGKLEKCYVTTGASLWGNYTAISGGLSEEDWIAFPYGKEVKDGADTVEDEDSYYDYGYRY